MKYTELKRALLNHIQKAKVTRKFIKRLKLNIKAKIKRGSGYIQKPKKSRITKIKQISSKILRKAILLAVRRKTSRKIFLSSYLKYRLFMQRKKVIKNNVLIISLSVKQLFL